jgi:hypothetical protein
VRQLQVLEEPPGIQAVGGEQQHLLQFRAAAAAGDVQVRHGDGLPLVVPEAQAVADFQPGAVLRRAVQVLDGLGLRGAERPDRDRVAGVRVDHPQRQPPVPQFAECHLVYVAVRAADRPVPQADQRPGLGARHGREHRRPRRGGARRLPGDIERLVVGPGGTGDQEVLLAQQVGEPARPTLPAIRHF